MAAALIVMLCAAIGTYGGDLLYDLTTADKRVPAEEDTRQKHDQKKKAFVASVYYNDNAANFWRIVLDRPLTPKDAVNVSCHASTAQTVIDFPPQGGASYEGVVFDLTQDDPIPYITDGDPEDQGKSSSAMQRSPSSRRLDRGIRRNTGSTASQPIHR